MKRLHIIGRKDHGKTTLVVDLVKELTGRGLRVGTIKHTHHRHELDVPGKDSHRHREAGANVVGVLSQGMTAIFLPTPECDQPERYAVIETAFADCDWVIVEGDSTTTAPKIEVWRASLGTEPLAAADPTVLAIVTDDAHQTDLPTLSRVNIREVADWVLSTPWA